MVFLRADDKKRAQMVVVCARMLSLYEETRKLDVKKQTWLL